MTTANTTYPDAPTFRLDPALWLHLGPGLIFTIYTAPRQRQSLRQWHIRVHMDKDTNSDHTLCGRMPVNLLWGDCDTDAQLGTICVPCLFALEQLANRGQRVPRPDEDYEPLRHAGRLYAGSEASNWRDWDADFWDYARDQIRRARDPLVRRIDNTGTLTVQDAMARLGLSEDRVRRLAISRQVGHKRGRDWMFSSADLAAMQKRTPGRPRGGATS